MSDVDTKTTSPSLKTTTEVGPADESSLIQSFTQSHKKTKVYKQFEHYTTDAVVDEMNCKTTLQLQLTAICVNGNNANFIFEIQINSTSRIQMNI